MKSIHPDFKKVVGRVKKVQDQLQVMLKDNSWVEEARKYADRQGKEAKRLFAGDVDRVKSFLERERKELERFQKELPGEFEKFRKFVGSQKDEISKLLENVRKVRDEKPSRRPRKSSKKA